MEIIFFFFSILIITRCGGGGPRGSSNRALNTLVHSLFVTKLILYIVLFSLLRPSLVLFHSWICYWTVLVDNVPWIHSNKKWEFIRVYITIQKYVRIYFLYRGPSYFFYSFSDLWRGKWSVDHCGLYFSFTFWPLATFQKRNHIKVSFIE